MSIQKKSDGWYWGKTGPFSTRLIALTLGKESNLGHHNKINEEIFEQNTEYTVAKCVIYFLHSVTNSHILHLQTRSYAEHKALEAYYTEIGDLINDFVEAYQGKYGIIEDYPEDYKLPTPSIEYLVGLSTYLQEARLHLPQDTELQNLLDEIASLLDNTLYKLRFLS